MVYDGHYSPVETVARVQIEIPPGRNVTVMETTALKSSTCDYAGRYAPPRMAIALYMTRVIAAMPGDCRSSALPLLANIPVSSHRP